MTDDDDNVQKRVNMVDPMITDESCDTDNEVDDNTSAVNTNSRTKTDTVTGNYEAVNTTTMKSTSTPAPQSKWKAKTT